MSVDGTDCPIQEPKPFSKKWYSIKLNGPALWYEATVALHRSEIVWVKGPFPAGPWKDDTIFKRWLMRKLEPDELVIVNKGYRFILCCVVPNKFFTLRKRCTHNQIRARHESVNTRMKKFNCLKNKWRHERRDHGHAFKAVAVITQLASTDDEPLMHPRDFRNCF